MIARDDAQLLQQAIGLHRQGRLDQAARLYRAVVSARPDNVDALHLLGLLRSQQGQPAEAVVLIGKALRIDPAFAVAHSNFGLALAALGRHDEAVASFEKALALQPDIPEARNNYGLSLQALHRDVEALAQFERAIALRPAYVEALNNRGNSLRALRRFDEAIAAFEKAAESDPASATALSNLGAVLHQLGRDDEAGERFRQAIAAAPGYAAAHYNLGGILLGAGRYEEAISLYDQALARAPELVEAQLDQSMARLALGAFEAGFRQFEERWRAPAFAAQGRGFAAPLWLGAEDLNGRTILLHAEQGLGDTLNFARYVPLVAQRGATVVLEVQPALRRVMTGIEGARSVLAAGDALPPFDFHCPLMSLPLAFGTTVETIPGNVPYLVPEAGKRAAWEPVVGPDPRPRIGLVWSGNQANEQGRNRSLPFPLVERLMAASGRRFTVLQKEFRDGEAAALAGRDGVRIVADGLADFADTAAVISHLDLVISVDTAVAHLAGALGKPLWVLLPFVADWRWLRDRTDSPWYPSARLFRQQEPRNWETVIAAVETALAELA